MMDASITRLATFAQHSQPKEYGGSDMMRADIKAVLQMLGDTAEIAAKKSENAAAETAQKALKDIKVQLMRLMTAAEPIGTGWVEGYKIKTGALHSILGIMSSAGHPVPLPTTFPPVPSENAVLNQEILDEGLRLHHLKTDTPSQLSDSFRNGARWGFSLKAAPTPQTHSAKWNDQYEGEILEAARQVVHAYRHDGPGDVCIALTEKFLPLLAGPLEDCGWLPKFQRAEPKAQEVQPPIRWMPILGTRFGLHMDVLDEHQARLNHSQSLLELAGRGGLSLTEALALVRRSQWHAMKDKDAAEALCAAIASITEKKE